MAYLFNEEQIKSVADLLTWLQTDEDRLLEASLNQPGGFTDSKNKYETLY